MVRTAREHGLSWLLLIIFFGVVGLLSLIFGPNVFQNPLVMGFLFFFLCFMGCWLFGYIHPQRWKKKIEKRKEHTYVKEGPGISKLVSLEEERSNVNKMLCPHCGILQEQKTKFCTKCGKKIE